MGFPVINVQVVEHGSKKIVHLRSVDRSTFPWTFHIIESAEAGDHQQPHSRNCDFETEARHYFELLKK